MCSYKESNQYIYIKKKFLFALPSNRIHILKMTSISCCLYSYFSYNWKKNKNWRSSKNKKSKSKWNSLVAVLFPCLDGNKLLRQCIRPKQLNFSLLKEYNKKKKNEKEQEKEKGSNTLIIAHESTLGVDKKVNFI